MISNTFAEHELHRKRKSYV